MKFLRLIAVATVGIGLVTWGAVSWGGGSKNLQASLSGGERKIPEFMPNEAVVLLSDDFVSSASTAVSVNSLTFGDTLSDIVERKIRSKVGDVGVDIETEVLFDTPLDEEKKERIKRKNMQTGGVSTVNALSPPKMVFVHIKSTNKSTEELLSLLEGDDAIAAVQPNYVYSVPTPAGTEQMHIQANTSKENANDLWNIFNNADGAGIEADKVWQRGYTGQGTVVAVVDTGVDTDHPDLVDNIWRNEGETNCHDGIDNDQNGYIDDCIGWDFGDNDNDPNPDLRSGIAYHGSHVAGIIAAAHDNSGVVGVAPEAEIMPVKSFPDGGFAQTTTVVNAIQYAWQNGADVISVSIGRKDACSGIERSVIDAAMNAGSLVVTSSGNADPANGLIIPFSNAPAVCDKSIAVGATDIDKSVPEYSNYFNNMVNVVAPGGSSANMIISADPDGGYMGSSGTSMATPHISGIAALLFSKNPLYTPQDVASLLCNGSEDIETPGQDAKSGCGFANANRIFSLTEGSAPVISNARWNTNPVTGNPSWTSTLSFSVCDTDNNLSGGNIRLWNSGTKTLLVGSTLPWGGVLPDASDCDAPLSYSVPVNFENIGAGEYCIDLEVSDADGNVSNILPNICIVREGVPENVQVTPLLQNIATGETPRVILASGAESYTFSLDAGSTGITKQNCTDGAVGRCVLSAPTHTGTATLTVQGETTSKVAVVHATDKNAPTGDFSLKVSVNKLSPKPGDDVVFTIRYKNNGTKNYSAVRITDTYDVNAIEITSVPQNCVHDAPLLSCFIGALPPGESGTIAIEAKIK